MTEKRFTVRFVRCHPEQLIRWRASFGRKLPERVRSILESVTATSQIGHRTRGQERMVAQFPVRLTESEHWAWINCKGLQDVIRRTLDGV